MCLHQAKHTQHLCYNVQFATCMMTVMIALVIIMISTVVVHSTRPCYTLQIVMVTDCQCTSHMILHLVMVAVVDVTSGVHTMIAVEPNC